MISVIMPAYNSEKYIQTAVKSVLAQTYRDFELIIVDDGSRDGTLEIINDLARQDPRIRIFSQPNAGPSSARNRGIRESLGDWLYFMDSDDTIEPEMFDGMVRAGENTDMVICGVMKHFLQTKSNKQMALNSCEINSQDEFKAYLSKVIADPQTDVFFNYIWNRFIKASLIKNNNIRFDENIILGEDFLFITEVFLYTEKIRILEKCYYHYYIYGNVSLRVKFDPKELERRKIMYSAMVRLYQYHGIYDENKNNLQIHEGRFSFIGIRKVKYPSCHLNKLEKVKYIIGFLIDERCFFMLKYIANRLQVRLKK